MGGSVDQLAETINKRSDPVDFRAGFERSQPHLPPQSIKSPAPISQGILVTPRAAPLNPQPPVLVDYRLEQA